MPLGISIRRWNEISALENKKAAKEGLDSREKIWKVPVTANKFDNLILNLSESNFVKHIMWRKSDDGM